MKDKLSPVQVASVRWVVLEVVHAAIPFPATERMCTDAMLAAYPSSSLERTRSELDYLESAGLVEVKRAGVLPWSVKLTKLGRDVVEYVADEPAGILRPQQYR